MTTNHRSWEMFWESRSLDVSDKVYESFVNNFMVMWEVIIEHFRIAPINSAGLTSLEVGCGRGVLSSMFRRIGFTTMGIDIYDKYARHQAKFAKFDILTATAADMHFFKDDYGTFDVVFSYGLLEHYEWPEQRTIMERCLDLTRKGGIAIHYVVPLKLTNIFEDRKVARYECGELLDRYTPQWVYPVFYPRTGKWKTNRWIGKGFIIHE